MDKLRDLFHQRGAPPELTLTEDPETGAIYVELLNDDDVVDLDDFDLFGDGRLIDDRPEVDAHWFAPGEPVAIHGLTIDCGYIYVGDALRPSGHAAPDPSLITPRLPISQKKQAQQLPYWPRYDSLSKAQRAIYLTWLAGGRKDPDVDIGYVFIFFYGLEVFVLANPTADPRAIEQLPGIHAELARLLKLYGHNPSFRHYASGLMNIIDLILLPTRPFTPPAPPRLVADPGWIIPKELPSTIGQFVANRMVIPPEWALAWAWYSPQVRLRTPALRCRDEFARLFTRRYAERFGDGLKLRPGKGRLRASYVPANRTLGFRVDNETSIPDVFHRRGPVKKLVILTEDVTIELEPYNRWLVRNGDKKRTVAELAYLPPDLIAPDNAARRDYLAWLEARLGNSEAALIPGAELIARWRGDDSGRLTDAQADAYLGLTAGLGFGVEPDPRYGPKKLTPTISAALFRLPERASQCMSSDYRDAAVLIHLAATVAVADGQASRSEARRIGEAVVGAFDLPPDERARLFAHLFWLSTTKISLSGMKSRLAPLSDERRAAFGDILIAIAAADGVVSPAEVTALTKIFRLLDLDPDSVAARLHSAMTGSAPGPAATSGALDAATIDRIQSESHAVSALLGDIFADDEPAPAIPEPEEPPALDEPVIEGLDAPHTRLLGRLSQRPAWPRADYDALAADCGVMPGGAIDVINDLAFDIIGDPVIEGDEVLTIHTELIQDLYS